MLRHMIRGALPWPSTLTFDIFFSKAFSEKPKISFHLPLMSSNHDSEFSGRWKEIFELREVLGDEKTKDKVGVVLRGGASSLSLGYLYCFRVLHYYRTFGTGSRTKVIFGNGASKLVPWPLLFQVFSEKSKFSWKFKLLQMTISTISVCPKFKFPKNPKTNEFGSTCRGGGGLFVHHGSTIRAAAAASRPMAAKAAAGYPQTRTGESPQSTIYGRGQHTHVLGLGSF